MCNGDACVDYQVAVGGDGYFGVRYETQTSTLPPPAGGGTGMVSDTGNGSGQGIGNTGGANPGSGCYGSCGSGTQTGTVTAGPDKPIKRPPTHEN